MTFGQKLAKARQESGLTQDQLAEKLFITRQGLSRWENDKTQPSLEMISLICKALDKSPSYFIDSSSEQIRLYKHLSKEEKVFLFAYWKAKYCKQFTLWKVLLMFFLGVSLGVTLHSFIRLIDFAFNASHHPDVILLSNLSIGCAILALLSGVLCVFYSRKSSILYNRYLLSEHNILRYNKFL